MFQRNVTIHKHNLTRVHFIEIEVVKCVCFCLFETGCINVLLFDLNISFSNSYRASYILYKSHRKRELFNTLYSNLEIFIFYLFIFQPSVKINKLQERLISDEKLK